MFLHYILRENKSSLISRVFWAQVNKPIKNDWAVIIQEDLRELEIFDSFQQIENYSKQAWKTKIKAIIKKKAFSFLKDQIEERKLTKISNIKYSEFKMQEYFNCSDITKNTKLFTFKLRTRMIQVGGNFGQKEVCPVCKTGFNDQRHLLECSTLKLKIPELTQVGFNYDDIYEEDPALITNISQLVHKTFKKREIILDQK